MCVIVTTYVGDVTPTLVRVLLTRLHLPLENSEGAPLLPTAVPTRRAYVEFTTTRRRRVTLW